MMELLAVRESLIRTADEGWVKYYLEVWRGTSFTSKVSDARKQWSEQRRDETAVAFVED
jgi:hypothetical protein